MWRVSGSPMVFPAPTLKTTSFSNKVTYSTVSMLPWAPAPRLGAADLEDADDEMELSDDGHEELHIQKHRENLMERMDEDVCAMHLEDADVEEDFELSSRRSDAMGDGLQDSWRSCNWVARPVPLEINSAAHAVNTHGQIGLDVLDNDFQAIDFDGLEAAIGYRFKARTLLVEAITHASRLSSESPCYQRLEFVGDAVLDHLITKYFFVNYKDLAPGRLTDLRQATVNNENFARIAVKHKFHIHLQHGSAALQAKIHAFVKNIQTELDKPGLNAFGLGDFKAPKVLGDILESIAGAVFLDAGLDTEKVWQIFEPLLQPMVTPETLLKHPVSELQERCQQRVEDLRYHAYRRDNLTFVVEVHVNEEFIAVAANSKKKMAQKLAARNALVILKKRDERLEAAAEEDASSDAAEVFPPVPVTHSNMPVAQQNFYDMCMKRNCKQTLYEICMSQKWPKPEYKCVSEVGLAHAKKFTYSVRIFRDHGWSEELAGEPMPSVKRAKDSAAATLLQHLKRW
ncbi:hypothetical protein Mapa_014494 [Marchantia paleacea]|nr:hypothetical protein Mapa_014494 [Marchantia paleacea]